MVILSMILLVITSVISQVQKTWKGATGRLAQFREARLAYDTVARGLRQATVHSYSVYHYPGTALPSSSPDGIVPETSMGIRFDEATNVTSAHLGKSSELPGHGVVFQIPAGLVADPAAPFGGGSKADEGYLKDLSNLLSVRGYFVQFASDKEFMPSGLRERLASRSRFRLLEYRPPAEENPAFDRNRPLGGWTSNVGADASSAKNLRVVATNIVAMVMAVNFADSWLGIDSSSTLGKPHTKPVYSYDSYQGMNGSSTISKGSIPTSVQLVMVAVDEDSASRMLVGGAAPDLLKEAGASFKSEQNLEGDIKSLKAYMASKNYNYRLFSSHVYIPSNNY